MDVQGMIGWSTGRSIEILVFKAIATAVVHVLSSVRSMGSTRGKGLGDVKTEEIDELSVKYVEERCNEQLGRECYPWSATISTVTGARSFERPSTV